MTTLYIRMPPRVAAESAEDWRSATYPFALAAATGAIQREGSAPLSELFPLASGSQRVVLLIAASDVTLLQAQVPPLPPARLRAALPGLVEERLIADPADCVIVAGPPAGDAPRAVAVMQRDWLESLLGAFLSSGAKRVLAVPAQLCLPAEEGQAFAAVISLGAENELALRLSRQEGMGLAIFPGGDESVEQQVLQTVEVMTAQVPVTMYVPQAQLLSYQHALEQEGGTGRISVQADSWTNWIAGADQAGLDLAAGMQAAGGAGIDWKKWRWPVVLASIFLLVNIVALNVDWWRLKKEADGLRALMTQTYRTTFPKDPVIVDPLAQMKQKLGAARQGGMPDDFAALAAVVAEEMNGLAQSGGAAGAPPAIAGLEYRERSLIVKFKQGSQAPTDQMKAALARHNLTLASVSAQGAGEAWQIRSAR